MTTEQARGKAFLLTVVVAIVILALLTVTFHVIAIGPTKLPQQLVRLLFTLAMCHYLYRGRAWAKWFTIVVLLIGSVSGVVTGVPALGKSPLVLYLLFISSVYGLSAIALLFSSSISAFLQYQRLRGQGAGSQPVNPAT